MASMASLRLSFLLLIGTHVLLLTLAQDDGSQLLNGINDYRTKIGIPILSENKGATCLASQVLTQFESTACSNSTGLDTNPSQEADYPNFANWLSTCNIPLERAKEGQILPDCVPAADASDAVSTAVQNYTRASADPYVNDTTYTSAGAASSNEWFVLILATNSTTGDYQQQASGASLLPAPLTLLYFILGPLVALAWYCA